MDKTLVIYIAGDNNQILPNATEAVQNFYGGRLGEPVLIKEFPDNGNTEVELFKPGVPVNASPYTPEIARGELRIYYPDADALTDILERVARCRDAVELANLVVNEMLVHSILTDEIALKTHFIDSLRALIGFTKGSSVNNIRQHIRKLLLRQPGKKWGEVEGRR